MDPEKEITLGDIVIYNLNDQQQLEARGNHMGYGPDGEKANGDGYRKVPAVVVAVWSQGCVNLKVLTDGPNNVWAKSAGRGVNPGQWLPKE